MPQSLTRCPYGPTCICDDSCTANAVRGAAAFREPGETMPPLPPPDFRDPTAPLPPPLPAPAPAALRVVELGDWATPVTLKAYMRGWRDATRLAPGTRVDRVPGRIGGGTAGDVVRACRLALDERISAALPYYNKGRKWHGDWQRAMVQAAWQVNMPRLVLDWLPYDLVPRFGHRLRRRGGGA